MSEGAGGVYCDRLFCRSRRAANGAALIRQRRLPRCQGQTIGFDEHAIVFRLRLGKKAKQHEAGAKHQPHQHHPTVRAFVVKIRDATNSNSRDRTTKFSD
jgi:hypothetical protein